MQEKVDKLNKSMENNKEAIEKWKNGDPDVEVEIIKRTCRNCGTEFEVGVGNKLCSHECRIENIEKYRKELHTFQKELYKKHFK